MGRWVRLSRRTPSTIFQSCLSSIRMEHDCFAWTIDARTPWWSQTGSSKWMEKLIQVGTLLCSLVLTVSTDTYKSQFWIRINGRSPPRPTWKHLAPTDWNLDWRVYTQPPIDPQIFHCTEYEGRYDIILLSKTFEIHIGYMNEVFILLKKDGWSLSHKEGNFIRRLV